MSLNWIKFLVYLNSNAMKATKVKCASNAVLTMDKIFYINA